MKTVKLTPEKAAEFGIIQPIPDRDNEYIFHGKPIELNPEDRIEVEMSVSEPPEVNDE